VELSVIKLAEMIPTESDAYALLERMRWGDGEPTCPHCGSERAYFLKPSNGTSRKTRTGSKSERRVWKCASCRKQFSALTGTIFHGTKISVRKWLFVVFEMCASKNGISAREIERRYDLTPKSAWFMTHRIREAMKREPLVGMLRGTVVADETFIGGRPKNKHRQGKQSKVKATGRGSGGTAHLTPVLSLVNKETGEVRSHVVADVTGPSLKKVISEHVDVPATSLMTDAGAQYKALGREFASHETVDHGAWEYVRGPVSTNVAENYFSQLKRSIDGTHHHVSVEHLPRYLAEFDYRYSTRKLSDTARTSRLMKQAGGRRLTYQPLADRP
jgi:transposase-like protein